MATRVELTLLPAPPDRVAARNPRLGRLYDYWLRKRGDRAMPSRADIDPLEMREWLGNLLLVEFFGSVEQYRVRVDGTNLIIHGGGDRTGKGSETLTSDEERALIMSQYRPVFDLHQTGYFESQFTNSEGRFLREQKLLLPLSNDGVTVSMVLAGIYYHEP
ncbi:MAG TPA: PAS domain-containing protein [Dongiaceae bacterium]|jgi:hypothetical protein|nr:PAS domain-containing protein [Dongiaceae bacterium]